MEMTCKKHKKDVHMCVQNIINTFKQRMIQVPEKSKSPRIEVRCEQVDVILAYAAKAAYHQKSCALQWEPVVYKHAPDLMCESCGVSFRNMVLEGARRIGVL